MRQSHARGRVRFLWVSGLACCVVVARLAFSGCVRLLCYWSLVREGFGVHWVRLEKISQEGLREAALRVDCAGMPRKKSPRAAPPETHRLAVEQALAASGLSVEELARRLTLSPATVRRVLRGYQPIRSAGLKVLEELTAAGKSGRADGAEIDLARLRALVSYLAENQDLLPQLKLFLDRQDLR